jgi:zinc finger protein
MDLNDQLKPGGSIPEKGKKITLRVTKVEDLNRDVIKVCLYDVIKM